MEPFDLANVKPEDYRVPTEKDKVHRLIDIDIAHYGIEHLQKFINVDQIPIRARRPGFTYFEIVKGIQERYYPETQKFCDRAREVGLRPKGRGFKYFDEAPGYLSPGLGIGTSTSGAEKLAMGLGYVYVLQFKLFIN